MGGEWREVSLSDLTEPDSPITYGVVKPGPKDPNGVLFIRGGDIADGRILIEQLRTITRKVSAKYKRTLLRGGELVVSLVGNPGQVAIVPPELRGANIARQVGLIRLRGDVDARFVKYALSSKVGQAALGAYSLGSVQQVINLRDLKTVRLQLPPLPEQRAIAHILGTLDDKIELNRRMNATLEAMARALFKSWFVDFDPVIDNTLAAGNPIPDSLAEKAARRQALGERRKPLPESLWRLFPDRFVESELGWIPEGWRAGRLIEQFDLTMGQSPPGSTYNEDGLGLPFYQGRKDFGFRFPSHRVYCSAPTRIAEPGDTLVTIRAPVGDINMAMERCCIGRGVAAIRHKNLARSYTYYAMHSLVESFRRYEGQGTVFGSITKRNFESMEIVVPDTRIVESFERLVTQFDQSIGNLTKQIMTLAALRDALLPRLISGEIRLRDAKGFLGELELC